MASRISLFKNNAIIGWFQYSKTFEKSNIEEDKLPKNNAFVGNFKHNLNKVSLEKYELDLPVEKLLLYYKTLHTKPKYLRSVGTQTVDDYVIVR